MKAALKRESMLLKRLSYLNNIALKGVDWVEGVGRGDTTNKQPSNK